MKLLSCLFLVAACGVPAVADELHYTGQLFEVSRDRGRSPVKSFDVKIWTEENGETSFYLAQENRFALPWCEQYGQTSRTDAMFSHRGVVIGHHHKERNYTVPVGLPYFAEFDRLAPDASWERDGVAYEVLDEKMIDDTPCWRVRFRTGPARTHTMFVHKERPLVMAGTQTVFMGQGDRFEIEFKATEVRTLSADEDKAVAETTAALLQLKAELKRDDYDRAVPLSADQVAIATKHVPAISALTKETQFAPFSRLIATDVATRTQRMNRVDELAENMVNQSAPRFTLTDLKSQPVAASAHSGKVVILHFWAYSDEPLEQPYGQIGYLDFLNSRWKDKNVVVYGVAVDSRLTNPETRAAGIRSIRRLQQFMKLGYDVTFDSGAVLNAFGNPTRLGEELPLWVVINPEGKIVHYRTGFYEVDNEVGLKELDQLVRTLTPDTSEE